MKKVLKERNEILLALYMTIFSLIKPILINMPESSTLILAIVTGGIIGLELVLEWIYTKKINVCIKYMFFIIIVYLWLLCEMLFRNNSAIGEIIYKFSIYGAIPILLCSKVKNYKDLLWIYSIFSIVNGVIYFFDPLNSYKVSGDYMVFGFCQMLPAYAGAIILFFIFKKKYGIILAIVFLVQMFLYANKGATICALTLLMASYVLFNRNKKMLLRRALIIIFFLCIILFNLEKIGEWLIELIRNLNLQTYSLRTFLNMLESNGDKVYHARTDIWKNAIQLFDEKTIIGNGVGYFESTFNVYTHNFFLDIAVSSGIIGIIIMLTVLIVSIKKVIKIQDDYKKYFLIIMFIISFVPMMFSLTYWSVMSFWIYFAIVFCSKKENLINNRNN